MMKRSRVITGLDIGSSNICAIQAEHDERGSMNVLGFARVPSRGVRRGYIVDLDGATAAITNAIDRLREKTLKKPTPIWVSVGNQSVSAQESQGMIRLSMRGREITESDVKKCVDAAGTIKLPFHRDLMHRIVQSYYVDDDVEVQNPVGLYGSRLGAKIVAVTASVPHLQNIQKAVNNAGYETAEFVYSGIAEGAALLSDSDKKRSVALIDIGSSTTEISIFTGGTLYSLEIIPLGGSDIKGALADDDNFITLQSAVVRSLDRVRKQRGMVEKILLAGGATLVDNVVERLESAVSIPVSIGEARGVVGNIRGHEKAISAASLGLVRYVFDRRSAPAAAKFQNPLKRVSAGIADIFSRYF
ncbi:MAG: cell division protein FtsA [Candidatus Omnitrophota bacterium]